MSETILRNSFSKVKLVSIVSFLCFLLSATVSLHSVIADTEITDCGTFGTAYEKYYMTSNITSELSDCIAFNNNNIVFDCKSHLLQYNGTESPNSYGVRLSGDNFTMENCVISNYTYDFIADSTINELINISNNVFEKAKYICLDIITKSNATIRANNFTDCYGMDIYTNQVSNLNISENIFTDNPPPIYNSILLYYITNGQVYNNYFNGSAPEDQANNMIFANTTRQYGNRIYGNGTEIGGNWYNIYATSCTDADIDGFCDSPYSINTNMIDYLPLSDKATTTTTTTTIPTTTTTFVVPENTSITWCVDNQTLAIRTYISSVVNGNQKVWSFIENKTCPNGCSYNECRIDPFWFYLIMLILIVFLIYFIYKKSNRWY